MRSQCNFLNQMKRNLRNPRKVSRKSAFLFFCTFFHTPHGKWHVMPFLGCSEKQDEIKEKDLVHPSMVREGAPSGAEEDTQDCAAKTLAMRRYRQRRRQQLHMTGEL